MTTPTKEQIVQLIAELEAGSNWLSGEHNVYSYNRQPKIAAMFLKAFAEQGLPELIEELRNPYDWKLEGFGHFKDVTMSKSDAPFKAAEMLSILARADLEATIEELTRKYQEHAGDKYTLQDTITEQATEIERLRKVIQLAAEDIRRCDYTPARSKLLVAIAAAPKQEK